MPYPAPGDPGRPRPRVDGFAVTALVLSVIGFVIFSVAFAIAALRRIGRGERRGKPLAIVALVLSALWLVGLVGAVAYHAGRTPPRSTAGAVTRPGTVAPADLQGGDCVEVPRDVSGPVTAMPIMPCSQTHNGQVFATIAADDTSYPGDNTLETEGLDKCRAAAQDYLDGKQTLLHVVVFVPTSTRWDLGDRKESCLLVDREKDITGEIRADA
jgi:Septum formation